MHVTLNLLGGKREQNSHSKRAGLGIIASYILTRSYWVFYNKSKNNNRAF
uniref:Uncharacterized protein n=1 Tax=Arundo donax TaxID=35708 RepID=A0A0A9BVW1_ARUDO